MEKLYEEKTNHINKLYEITLKMDEIVTNENFDELNNLFLKRQEIMNKIDSLDKELKNSNYANEEFDKIDVNNKKLIQKIIEIDSKLNIRMSQKKLQIRKTIADIDKRMELRNYTMDKSTVKEKGHFIKFRG